MTRPQSLGQVVLIGVASAYLLAVYFLPSQVWMGFTINALAMTIVALSWNVTGGFGGLSSFGHAAMYGTGAYASAILQVQFGVNAWISFAAGILAGALMGAFIGALSFRYGLKGSYFALVTLAFAEVLRILASAFEITGAGRGLQLTLAPGPAALQFNNDRPLTYTLLLVAVAIVMGLTAWMKYSRFGAHLVAVRENEDAARALGIDTYRVKVTAMAISGAIGGLAGAIYLQLWLFIDLTVVYGVSISVIALIGPIIGGAGTVWGPLVGTLGLHLLGEGAKTLLHDAPGLNFVLYAVVLIAALRFLPQGLMGLASQVGSFRRKGAGMLEVRNLTKRFGGLVALSDTSLDVPEGAIVGLLGPNGAGKTTCFTIIAGFTRADTGTVRLNGQDITGLPPHRICALGMVRTFQIVQPFAGLTVEENIAVGAYLRHRDRREALAEARRIGKRLGMEASLDRPAAALTIAGRKRLEIGRALATGAKLLLLDEVMAGLIPTEVDEIVGIIRQIREEGHTFLMIEHVMQAVMSLAETAYVLNYGRLIAHGTPQQLVQDPAVIEAYLGHGAASRLKETGRA